MTGIQRKSLDQPDETDHFPHGVSHEVHLGELTVGRSIHEPGWHWADHVQPIVGGTSCRVHHTGYVVRGRMHIRHDDGTEAECAAGDVMDILPGHDAWVVGDEPVETVEWVGAHGWASPPTGERILATLVFTDIVDSTMAAERLGDREWRRLLESHDLRLRSVLDRYRGRQVATTGDGMLALFDGAERAVRAAAAMHAAVAGLDLRIRVAVHTGEVELVPNNVRGVTVHVAARILSLADGGEVLVSGTTRELLSDDTLAFVDRGEHSLKGIAGRRRIYALLLPGERETATS